MCQRSEVVKHIPTKVTQALSTDCLESQTNEPAYAC